MKRGVIHAFLHEKTTGARKNGLLKITAITWPGRRNRLTHGL